MIPKSDYLTLDLAPLDDAQVWPRPLLLVAELGPGGRVAVSSTLHKLTGRVRLPPANPDLMMGILVVESERLRAPWPPEPPLPALYREVRRAVLHILYPDDLATELVKCGQLDREVVSRLPRGEVLHEAQVDEVWRTFWSAILPHLDTEALDLSRSMGGQLELYNMLAANPGCRELVRLAPMLGALLDPDAPVAQVAGMSLKDTVQEIVRRASVRRPGIATRRRTLPQGFISWLQAAPVRPATMPKLERLQVLRRLGLVMAAAGDVLSTERVEAIETDQQWYTLHAAAQHVGVKGAAAVLRSPEQALRDLDTVQPALKSNEHARRLLHLRTCMEIGGGMNQAPERFSRVRSLRSMATIAHDILHSHGSN